MPAQQIDLTKNAAERLSAYLSARRATKGLDYQSIHTIHAGTDREATLASDDLELLMQDALLNRQLGQGFMIEEIKWQAEERIRLLELRKLLEGATVNVKANPLHGEGMTYLEGVVVEVERQPGHGSPLAARIEEILGHPPRGQEPVPFEKQSRLIELITQVREGTATLDQLYQEAGLISSETPSPSL